MKAVLVCLLFAVVAVHAWSPLVLCTDANGAQGTVGMGDFAAHTFNPVFEIDREQRLTFIAAKAAKGSIVHGLDLGGDSVKNFTTDHDILSGHYDMDNNAMFVYNHCPEHDVTMLNLIDFAAGSWERIFRFEQTPGLTSVSAYSQKRHLYFIFTADGDKTGVHVIDTVKKAKIAEFSWGAKIQAATANDNDGLLYGIYREGATNVIASLNYTSGVTAKVATANADGDVIAASAIYYADLEKSLYFANKVNGAPSVATYSGGRPNLSKFPCFPFGISPLFNR